MSAQFHLMIQDFTMNCTFMEGMDIQCTSSSWRKIPLDRTNTGYIDTFRNTELPE